MPINQTPVDKIKIGDTVQVGEWPKPTVVKGIKIILHMDNNMDLVLPLGEKLWVVENGD